MTLTSTQVRPVRKRQVRDASGYCWASTSTPPICGSCASSTARAPNRPSESNLLLITPQDATTPELVEQLRQHKFEIVAALKSKLQIATMHLCKQALFGEFSNAGSANINGIAAELQKLPACPAREAALIRLERESQP